VSFAYFAVDRIAVSLIGISNFGETFLVLRGSSQMLFSLSRKLVVLMAWVTGLSAMAFAEAAAAEPAAGAKGRPALLNDAFNAFLEHQGRWAYTETHSPLGFSGRSGGETILRFDPSRRYAEQFVPVKLRGKTPSEKECKQWAERGEKAAKQRLDREQKLAAQSTGEEKPAVHPGDEVQLRVSGQIVTPELDRAKVVQEDETGVTYEVPMHPEGRGDANAMLDKFELTTRVNKQTHQFERATIRQRAPLRVKLIAKVTDTLLVFEFSTPDPRYPSVVTKFIADGHLALFFGKGHAMHNESVRTELRHVTPYDERFGVKVGPTRTLEF
jgi:hypothetical protein